MPTLAIDRPKTQPILSATEIIYEAGGPKNERPLFPPAQLAYALRGRWLRANLTRTSMHEAMEQMPDIPGIRIGIDPANRTLRVFDPLDTEDGFPVFVAYCELQEKYSANLEKMKPWPEKRIDGADNTLIKSWLFWARRLLDEKMLVHVAGTQKLPKMAGIAALPGKTRISWNNEMISYHLHLEDFDEYGRLKPELMQKYGAIGAQQAQVATGMGPEQMLAFLKSLGFTITPPAAVPAQDAAAAQVAATTAQSQQPAPAGPAQPGAQQRGQQPPGMGSKSKDGGK